MPKTSKKVYKKYSIWFLDYDFSHGTVSADGLNTKFFWRKKLHEIELWSLNKQET